MHYEVLIRGKSHQWSAVVPTKRQAEAMAEDGMEIIEVHNSMPAWVADSGLAGVWCFFEDIWSIPSRWFRK